MYITRQKKQLLQRALVMLFDPAALLDDPIAAADLVEEFRPVLADRLIRNTYKTLMSRGQKGCYIYCEDKPLLEYISQEIGIPINQ